MRAGIVEQQERTYHRAVAAVRKESADGKAVSNPMTAVWPHDFCNFSHDSLLARLAVHLLMSVGLDDTLYLYKYFARGGGPSWISGFSGDHLRSGLISESASRLRYEPNPWSSRDFGTHNVRWGY